jgi:hypothetical protein
LKFKFSLILVHDADKRFSLYLILSMRENLTKIDEKQFIIQQIYFSPTSTDKIKAIIFAY